MKLNALPKALALCLAIGFLPSAGAIGLSVSSNSSVEVAVQADSRSQLDWALTLLNGKVLEQVPNHNVYLVSVPSVPLSLPGGLDTLELNEAVTLAPELQFGQIEAGPGMAADWHASQPALQVVRAKPAHAHSTGHDVIVADIDSRFDITHPLLAERVVFPKDMVVSGSESDDGGLNQSSSSFMFEDESTTDLNQSSSSFMFEDSALNQSSSSFMFENSDLFQSSSSFMFEDTLLNQSSSSFMFEDPLLNQSSSSFMFEDSLTGESMHLLRTTLEGAGVFFTADSVIKAVGPAGAGYSHGTFTAGLIAVTAPDALIMPIRAFDDEGKTDLFTLAKSIYYAVDNGAQVINMSWGTDTDSPILRRAIRYAYKRNVVLIASTGNMNSEFEFYPAAYEEVISVSATDDLDRKASFSSFGEHVYVSAPGVNTISAYPGGKYAVKSGTSFSAPIVAGQAALLRSLDPDNTEWKIGATVVNIEASNPEYQDKLGIGRVDFLNSFER